MSPTDGRPAASGPPGGGREEPAAPRRRDWCSALLLLAIGAAVAWGASAYPLGTLRRIGPGFFPFALGLLLALLGGLVLLERAPAEPVEPVEPFDRRAFALITASILAFLALGRLAGLVPASFALVLLAALADRRTAPRTALLLAAGLAAFAALLFKGLLGLPFPLVGRAF